MADDTGFTGPYGRAALAYWSAGWRGVLPIGRRPGEKYPPPRGFTGHVHADDPSRADVQAWLDGPEAAFNIGLRLPPGVLGLDVDAYGGKHGGETLDRLTATWGDLPPTWVTSARDDGVSGIRLYRVPVELDGGPLHWPGEAGPNIEIIQTGHRYANVWPSVNPEAGGAVYRWLVNGLPWGGQLPTPGKLPALPEAWVRGLARSGPPAEKAEMALGDLSAWWAGLPAGRLCEPVRKVLDALDWTAGSRHEMARDAARALAAYGGEGHPGVATALAVLGAQFVEAVRPDRGDAAEAEWARMLVGAVRLAARAHPVPETVDPCALYAGEGVGFTPPLDFSGASTPPGGAIEAAADPPAPPGMTMLEALRAELLTPAQIKARPNPVPLVAGLLDMDTLAWLIAEPGSYKSFVALDLAGHVAAGQVWQGRRVRQGPVLYLAAEGAGGMTLRVRAWESEHGEMADAVRFLPRPVLVRNEPAWLALRDLVKEIAPALVILDTQARVTTGMEENSAKEMGMFIDAAEALRLAAGSCVLVIHHVGRSGGDARGSSAIDGAQGTELKLVKKDGLTAELTLDKQKDAADDTVMLLRLRRVEQGTDPETGRDLSSLVVLRADPFGPAVRPAAPPPDWEANATPNQADVVAALREHSDSAGASHTEARQWINERRKLQGRPEMQRTSYNSAVVALAKLGVIVRSGVARVILSEYLPDIDDGLI
jgi:hypothetical protein